MRVYDSLSKKFNEFRPVDDKKVVMYVCGLTPYDQAHIGHSRAYVAFDVIKRYLKNRGYSVFHIQNITDVEDKIIKRCKETGADPKKLTEANHKEALELFDMLNIKRADAYPKVTEHMPEIISFIKKLIERGYAYETESGIYFDVSKFKGYGKLSGQKLDEIKAGARIEVDETKNSAEDFALWKKGQDIIAFDSPWGKGRPGWHIECSALSEKYLKKAVQNQERETLDIHGGARDLIFPHHENEIAQSEAATGKPFVKYWMHAGFLTVNGEKMSKSLGNFITIKDALAKFSPMALRIFYLKSHYRSPVDYEEKSLKEAEEIYEKIRNTLALIDEAIDEKKEIKGSERSDDKIDAKKAASEFHAAMENDFDTPAAFAVLFKLMKEVNTEISREKIDKKGVLAAKKEIMKMLDILGIRIEGKKIGKMAEVIKVAESFGIKAKKPEEALEKLADMREEARKQKNYALSDEIRARLKTAGVIIEDKKDGIRWRIED